MFRILSLLFLITYTFCVNAQNVRTYIPKNAPQYFDLLQEQIDNYFPEIDDPAYFAALVEQESCISLKHSRCWSPTAELKTSREQGTGFNQITRAYNKDGSIRFDSLNDLRNAHMRELKELSWNNVTQRPDLQLRSLVLMTHDNFKRLYAVKNPTFRLQMSDAAYNGGPGGLNKERLQCGLTKGCDPQIWFGHVEKITIKSNDPIYGKRSPWMINREHVINIWNYRKEKYEPYFHVKTVPLTPVPVNYAIGK